MAKKQAKFFCENCGEEVAQNARFCNKCGRFFSAVRCPQCGKVGSSPKKKGAGSSLPVWIYILTLGVLAVMIVLLIKCSY